MTNPGFGEDGQRLAQLEREALTTLAALDELGLHQAAAYMSMALDAMRRIPPGPLPQG